MLNILWLRAGVLVDDQLTEITVAVVVLAGLELALSLLLLKDTPLLLVLVE
ncbi:MAG: hypothetical protein WAW00_03820 [Candidatus Moraniibacteriota bacterium]